MMEKYNYHRNIKEDILQYFNNNLNKQELLKRIQEEDEKLFDELYDDLWVCDEVTGNASGSYTFNTWAAEENICHNLDLLKEALEEFGGDFSSAFKYGAEYCDVTIRCYLLGWALQKALEEFGGVGYE